MLSLQEAVQKDEVKRQMRAVEKAMDGYGIFHPEVASVLNVQDDALRLQLQETMRAIPLSEFLAKSGTTGIAGAAYLVPDKIHDDLVHYAMRTDIVPLISAQVVTGWKGGDLKVDIVNDSSYKPKAFTSGGKMPAETVETMQPTLSPTSFGIAPRITGDLIEDASFEMVQYHLEKAALTIGKHSTNLAIAVLKAAADGWGTLNSATGATTDTTIWSEIVTAIRANEADGFPPNTLLITNESLLHNVIGTYGAEFAGGTAGDFWQPNQPHTHLPPTAAGFDMKIHTLDVLLSNSPQLHDPTDVEHAAFTTCVSVIFDRNNALLTGRKRWMQIGNYSDPVADLAGATITCRQDSVSLYDDSIYTLTEKT